MTRQFQRVYPPTQPAPGPAFWFPFRGGELLVREQDKAIFKGLREEIALIYPRSLLYFGTLRGIPCIACEISDETPVPKGWQAIGLRSLFGMLDDTFYGLAGYALHLLYWESHSYFCPACATPLEAIPGGWGKRCPTGDYHGYPQVTPAILVLIHDGDRILLTHKPGWGPRHSIIAGFVEPGEALEQCVRREVFEEVGLEIDTISYVGSQPWPYPDQIMIGFTARYAGGLVQPDNQELDGAAWFSFTNLPHLPAPSSLSHQIISNWAASRRARMQKGEA